MTPVQFGDTMAEVERAHIIDTLAHCDGNRTRASKILRISLRSLRAKLHDYMEAGVEVPPPGHCIGESAKPRRRPGFTPMGGGLWW